VSRRFVPSIKAPPAKQRNPLTRSVAGLLGTAFLTLITLACLATLPWSLGPVEERGGEGASVPRYNAGTPRAGRLPPSWWVHDEEDLQRLNALVPDDVADEIAARHSLTVDELLSRTEGDAARELARHHPTFLLGTDALGRSLLVRCLTGGGISLTVGLSAALISVVIGTAYGTVAAYAGGRVDAVLMRIVDVLYGLPYILLVVLFAVAIDALVDRLGRDLSPAALNVIGVGTLLFAIGSVSWLTMARVVRGQVLSLRNQPFMEAARVMGVPWRRQFLRHLLPNLAGPIIVYATLTVPQTILQESFLSFLGIGVRPPLPSWGNLAADGLSELNAYDSRWWLLVFPSVLLALTLLALNFVGEGLREALDPKRKGG